jgi:hypothetical protein
MRDEDAADGACPKDRCSSTVGIYPRCIDASLLFGDFRCPAAIPLNMTRARTAVAAGGALRRRRGGLRAARPGGGAVLPMGAGGSGGSATGSPAGGSGGSALQSQNGSRSFSRFLTPYNRLVGALTVAQRRASAGGGCELANAGVGAFNDAGSGPGCLRGGELDPSPFGRDPVFTATSGLYAGELAMDDFYGASEQVLDTEGGRPASPYGFFPHFYDTGLGRNASSASKDAAFVVPERANEFMLYFDERLDYYQASRMLTYMKDGGFVDYQTREISVEMNTLNAEVGLFSTFEFRFQFQVRTSH